MDGQRFNAHDARHDAPVQHGLSFDANYTLSKSMDDASDTGTTNAEYNLPQDPFAMRQEKALSSFDHRNRFSRQHGLRVAARTQLRPASRSGCWEAGRYPASSRRRAGLLSP